MSVTRGGGLVLIVEDDGDVREALISSLALRGYSSSGVRTLAAAQRILSKVVPDLIVLDLGLPDGDGSTLVQRLRASESPRIVSIPIVAVTGRANARAAVLGADAVLAKPVRLEELLSTLQRLADDRAVNAAAAAHLWLRGTVQ